MGAQGSNFIFDVRTFQLPIWTKCSLGFTCFLIVLLIVNSSEGTELHLRFKDEQNKEIHLSKAELLLVAWGDTKRLELKTIGDLLIIPLEPLWLRSRWRRFTDMENVYLFLQADGYVAVRSEPFLWIGAHGPPYGPRINKTEIVFPGGEKVVIQDGETVEFELKLRKPKERYLRLIDDYGRPVSGVKVSSYMFWSSSNHCGAFSGADVLGEMVSDDDGRIQITDGDFEYAFEFEKPLYVLKSPTGFAYIPPRLVTHLNAKETVVQLHQWQQRPLEMRITQNGKSVAGQVLYGRLAGCPCGACSGPVARTDVNKSDPNGILHIPNFYPEKWEYVFFIDAQEAILWSANPTEWPKTGIIDVELSHYK